VDGKVQATGEFNLTSDELGSRELPDSMEVGTIRIPDAGRHEITVTLYVDESESSSSAEFEAFRPGVAIVPLIVVLVLALATQMVEFSLLFAVFVGACMVSGNIKDGFKTTLDDYLLNAVADSGHAYVYLFTLFLSGMVGMMEKSGGMIGFTQMVAQYAKTARAGQAATFVIGIAVFFDDYANCLLAGGAMRPLTDMLFISREKLSFIVDATAAPIASLSPISSWVGFEVGLIQEQIDRIIELYGEENVTIETSGLAVFLQSVKYRYYPIFMMIMIPLFIFSQRDFGPMLIAERKTQVYKRTDGGDGATARRIGNTDEEETKGNQPRLDTPKLAFNMAIPIVLLVFFIFYLLVKTGDDGSGEQSFMDKVEGSDSYSALLWGTMAAALITLLLYLVQIVQDGSLVLPTVPVLMALFSRESEPLISSPAGISSDGKGVEAEEADSPGAESSGHMGMEVEETDKSAQEEAGPVSTKPRPLMSLFESVEAFLHGMGRIFPALIVLTLAWASGAIMVAVGADRLFSRWITGGISAESLPTLSFVISGFMALATGTSWGTMTILFPLICVPTYQVSNGDPTIFYATIAGILSGSVAGDHVSPISDTTVLSALASDCQLLRHVSTQAPYSVCVFILSILFGTLPIGRDAWPNIVGILLGTVAIVLFVYGVGVPVLCESGRYDIFTQLWILIQRDPESDLLLLQKDTIKACSPSSHEEGPNETEDLLVNPEDPAHDEGKTDQASDETPKEGTETAVEIAA